MVSTFLGFISPQEIVLLIILIILPGALILFLVILLIRYLIKKDKPKLVAQELDKHFNKYEESVFAQKDIRDYYPVKEGNKITLIRFDEIVDYSAINNYIFLTDVNGRDYLVDSNLTDLEAKLPEDFIRVHKSTIINKKLISEVKKLANGRYDLVMKCEKSRVISCSKNYNEKIKEIIDF